MTLFTTNETIFAANFSCKHPQQNTFLHSSSASECSNSIWNPPLQSCSKEDQEETTINDVTNNNNIHNSSNSNINKFNMSHNNNNIEEEEETTPYDVTTNNDKEKSTLNLDNYVTNINSNNEFEEETTPNDAINNINNQMDMEVEDDNLVVFETKVKPHNFIGAECLAEKVLSVLV